MCRPAGPRRTRAAADVGTAQSVRSAKGGTRPHPRNSRPGLVVEGTAAGVGGCSCFKSCGRSAVLRAARPAVVSGALHTLGTQGGWSAARGAHLVSSSICALASASPAPIRRLAAPCSEQTPKHRAQFLAAGRGGRELDAERFDAVQQNWPASGRDQLAALRAAALAATRRGHCFWVAFSGPK